jgi:hypothetical protein
MGIETPTKHVPVASKDVGSGVKFKFLRLTAEQVQQFLASTAGGSSRDLLVWMLLLNAAQVSRQETIKFSPRWRFGVDLDRKTVYRCLKRLASAGLIGVEFRRGKSPLVTVFDQPAPLLANDEKAPNGHCSSLPIADSRPCAGAYPRQFDESR